MQSNGTLTPKQRIDNLESEVKKLRQKLRELTEKINNLPATQLFGPIKLKRELKNLLHGNMLNRWNQSVKEQLVATLSLAEFPVLQEGGEIKSDLGDELTSQQWEKVTLEFFNGG